MLNIKKISNKNKITIGLIITVFMILLCYLVYNFIDVKDRKTMEVKVLEITPYIQTSSIAGQEFQKAYAVATIDGKQYINKSNTVKLLLQGTDENYSGNNLTESNIVVKVGGTTITPAQKNLGSAKEIQNGVQYELTISGITGDGKLTIEVEENTLTDKSNNNNILTTFDSEIIVDNTAPEITANNITYGETLSIQLKDAITNVQSWAITSNNEEPSTDWTDVDSADITVTKAGLTTGTYWIWAKDSVGNISSKSIVVNAKNASTLTVSLSEDNYTYDGTEKKPTIVVKDGTKTLTAGTDYTFTYSNNINAGTAKVTITGKGNYTKTKIVDFTINARTLTVTADALSKKYGASDPELTYTYSGQLSGQTPNFTGNLARAEGEDRGTYAINQGTLQLADNSPFLASNYSIKFVTANFTIERIYAVITSSSYTGTYDGEEHSISVEVEEVPNSNTEIWYSTTEQLAYANYTNGTTTKPTITDVGTLKVYWYVRITNPNYMGKSGSNTITINKKELTVTANALSKKYGESDPELTYAYSGQLSGQTPNFTGNLARAEGEDRGTYAINQGTLQLADNSPFLASNYSIKFVTANFTIERIYAVITSSSYTGTYDGNEHSINVEVEEVPNSDTEIWYSTTESLAYANYTNGTTTKPTITDVGTLKVYWYVRVTNSNYMGKSGSNTITINKKELTVTADDVSKKYSESDPELTYTYSGQVSGQTPNFTGNLARDAGEDKGTYAINQGTLQLSDNSPFLANNYSIKFVTANFTINRINIRVTKNSSYTGTYDGQEHTITLEVEDIPNSNTEIWYSTTESLVYANHTNGTTTKPTMTDAGTMTVYWYILVTNPNYMGRSGKNTITINKATPEVTLKIEGTNQYGETLTATPTTLSDGEKTYQWWYSDSSKATSGENISGATQSTYVIGSGLVGKYIGCTVEVSATNNFNACSASCITNTSNKTSTVTKASLTLELSQTTGSVSYANGKGSFTVTPKGYIGSDTGTLSVRTTNSSYITVDSGNGEIAKNNTAVTVNYTGIKYYTVQASITVSIAATDDYNAVYKTYKVTITDSIVPTKAPNITAKKTDNSGQSLGSIIGSTTNVGPKVFWTDTATTYLAFAGGADAGSGVSTYAYATSATGTKTDAKNLTFTATTSGVTYYVFTKDKAGNYSTVYTAITVKLDTTAPTIETVTATIVSNNALNINIEGGVDEGGSGLKSYTVYNSSGTSQGSVNSTSGTATISLTSNTGWYTDDYVVKAMDTAGNTTSTTIGISYYTVNTPAGLKGLATATNASNGGSFSGRQVYQTEDISLSSYSRWDAIGGQTNPFQGTYSGYDTSTSSLKNRNITDITLGGSSYVGLFGKNEGKIEYITVKNVSTSGNSGYAGAIVGYNSGIISHCFVTGTSSSVNSISVTGPAGGISSYNDGGTIENSTVAYANIDNRAGEAYAGGIVSCNTNYGIIRYCTVKDSTILAGSAEKVGGIAGVVESGKVSNSGVNNVAFGGDVSFIGGIAGRVNGGTITYCNASAISVLTASGTCVGGIVGSNTGGTITSCYSSETIGSNSSDNISTVDIGKIVGDNGNTISKCYSTATYSNVTGTNIGGLVGSNSGTISQCYNKGATQPISGSYLGGIVGYNTGTISYAYNTGTVKYAGAGGYSGGIAGYNNNTIKYAYNTGTITKGTGGGYPIGGEGSSSSPGGTYTYCYYLSSSISSGTYKGIKAEIGKLKTLPGINTTWENNFKIDIDNKNNGYPLLEWQEGSDPKTNAIYYYTTSSPTVTGGSSISISMPAGSIYIYIPKITSSKTATISGTSSISATYMTNNSTSTLLSTSSGGTVTKATTAKYSGVFYISGMNSKFSINLNAPIAIP